MFKKQELVDLVTKAKSASKQRKFKQTVDLGIMFAGVDFQKQENRLNMEVFLPNGLGREVKIGAFVDKDMLSEVKGKVDTVVSKEQLETLGKEKKKAKKIANQCDIFVAQVSLMPLVGKNLGQILAPRDKMPKPLPPNVKIEPIAARMKNTVKIKNKGKFMPIVQVAVGSEEMDNTKLAENVLAVLTKIEEGLPKGRIKKIYLKTSMGPAVKLDYN